MAGDEPAVEPLPVAERWERGGAGSFWRKDPRSPGALAAVALDRHDGKPVSWIVFRPTGGGRVHKEGKASTLSEARGAADAAAAGVWDLAAEPASEEEGAQAHAPGRPRLRGTCAACGCPAKNHPPRGGRRRGGSLDRGACVACAGCPGYRPRSAEVDRQPRAAFSGDQITQDRTMKRAGDPDIMPGSPTEHAANAEGMALRGTDDEASTVTCDRRVTRRRVRPTSSNRGGVRGNAKNYPNRSNLNPFGSEANMSEKQTVETTPRSVPDDEGSHENRGVGGPSENSCDERVTDAPAVAEGDPSVCQDAGGGVNGDPLNSVASGARALRVREAFRSQVELTLPWAGPAASLLASLVGCLALVEPVYLAGLLEGLAERFGAHRVSRFFGLWRQLAGTWPELSARVSFGGPPATEVEAHGTAAAIWSVRSLENVSASTRDASFRWPQVPRQDAASQAVTRAYTCAARALVGLIGDCAEQVLRGDVAADRGAALALGALALVGELETAGVTRARLVAQPGLVRCFVLWVDPELEEQRLGEVDKARFFTEALNHLRQWRHGRSVLGFHVDRGAADAGLARLVEAPQAQHEDAFQWEVEGQRISGTQCRKQVRLASGLVVSLAGGSVDETEARANRLREAGRRVGVKVEDAQGSAVAPIEVPREPTPGEVRDVARLLAQRMADVTGVPEVGTAAEVLSVARQVADWRARRGLGNVGNRCPETVTVTTRGYVATTLCGLAAGHGGPHRDPLDVEDAERAQGGDQKDEQTGAASVGGEADRSARGDLAGVDLGPDEPFGRLLEGLNARATVDAAVRAAHVAVAADRATKGGSR